MSRYPIGAVDLSYARLTSSHFMTAKLLDLAECKSHGDDHDRVSCFANNLAY